MTSVPSMAAAIKASLSSASSAFWISSMRGCVAGCFGVKTVQQSSYGREDVSNVPIFYARSMISLLSMPMAGRKTGIFTTASVQPSASIVWLAT